MKLPLELRWLAPEAGGAPHEVIWPLTLAGGLVLARFAPWALFPFPHCPMKLLSGIPCAGCGGTRAANALLALDLDAAFRWNPLVTLGLLAALVFVVYAAAALAFRTRRVRLVGLSPLGRAVAIASVLGNWLWLIADGR